MTLCHTGVDQPAGVPRIHHALRDDRQLGAADEPLPMNSVHEVLGSGVCLAGAFGSSTGPGRKPACGETCCAATGPLTRGTIAPAPARSARSTRASVASRSARSCRAAAEVQLRGAAAAATSSIDVVAFVATIVSQPADSGDGGRHAALAVLGERPRATPLARPARVRPCRPSLLRRTRSCRSPRRRRARGRRRHRPKADSSADPPWRPASIQSKVGRSSTISATARYQRGWSRSRRRSLVTGPSVSAWAVSAVKTIMRISRDDNSHYRLDTCSNRWWVGETAHHFKGERCHRADRRRRMSPRRRGKPDDGLDRAEPDRERQRPARRVHSCEGARGTGVHGLHREPDRPIAGRVTAPTSSGCSASSRCSAQTPTRSTSHSWRASSRRPSRTSRDLLLFTSAARDGSRHHIYRQNENRLRLVDACILIGNGEPQMELSRLASEGYPFVFIGRREIPGVDLPYVTADYAGATQKGSSSVSPNSVTAMSRTSRPACACHRASSARMPPRRVPSGWGCKPESSRTPGPSTSTP